MSGGDAAPDGPSWRQRARTVGKWFGPVASAVLIAFLGLVVADWYNSRGAVSPLDQGAAVWIRRVDRTERIGDLAVEVRRPVVEGASAEGTAEINRMIEEIYDPFDAAIADAALRPGQAGWVNAGYEVLLASSEVVSIVIRGSIFVGGANPALFANTVTANPETGQLVFPNELFSGRPDWPIHVVELACDAAEVPAGHCWLEPEDVTNPTGFSFDRQNVHFYWGECVVAACVYGPATVSLSYGQLDAHLNRAWADRLDIDY